MDNNNNPPEVVIEPQAIQTRERLRFLDMFEVRDIDPESVVTRFQFRDNTVGGGNFELGNRTLAANVWHEVPFQQVGSVGFRGADQFVRDGFSIRVFDGQFWSNVTTSVITSGNSSPVLQVTPGRVSAFDTTPIANRLNFIDADGDAPVRYQFFDDDASPEGGQFLLRGVPLPQREFFTIEASELSGLAYRGAVEGREQEVITARAFDGFSWSEFSQFQITTTTEPVVVQEIEDVLVNQRRHASVFFSVLDQDADPTQLYVITDLGFADDSGFWEFRGERLTAGEFTVVRAEDFNELFYVGASRGPQQEEVLVQVFDGFQFSDISRLTIRTVTPPTITANDASVQANHYLNFATGGSANVPGTVPDGTTFLTASDADGDAIDQYLFRDHRFNLNGGQFFVDGTPIPQGDFFRVAADQLDTVEYRGGVVGPQQELITVQVLANGVWSEQTTFSLSTLENRFRPTVDIVNVTARTGTVQRLDSLFSWEDLDGDILQTFSFFDTGDSPESGFFTVNNVVQPARQFITLPFDQLSTVRYHLSDFANTENIRLIVSDGRLTSQLVTSTITSVAKPEIDATVNDISLDTLQSVPASSLIRKVDNGPAFTQYQVYDESFDEDPLNPPADRTGRLFLRSPGPGNSGEQLQGGVVHTLTAEEFSRLEFQGAETDFGRSLDPFIIRADNGVTGWTEWERVNVNTDPGGANALISGQQWFDPRGGPKTTIEYTFIDGIAAPRPTYYACGATPDEECNTGDDVALSQIQREAVREALQYYENFADVDFVEVAYTGTAANAAITFGAAIPDPNLRRATTIAYGQGHIDIPLGNVFSAYGAYGGDVWFDTPVFAPATTTDVGLGSEFRAQALELIGGVLGLSGSGRLSIFQNFDYNTIVSPQRDSADNPLEGYDEAPSTAQLYDVVQIQRLYGANAEFRTGNDHWGNFFAGSYPHFIDNDESHQTTLWDAGGIDTLNYTNHEADESIDLREGSFSTINGVVQSLRIAYGTVIENARGGTGDDTIRGNEIPNLLFGNDGDDVLRGGGDNDISRGGAGSDTYIWSLGDGRDIVREEGNGGIDTVEFFDPSGSIDSLEDDFVFRRFGDELRIDLTLNQGEGQGTVVIADFGQAGSEVELMRFHGLLGDQIGPDIDLLSIFETATSVAQTYTVTNQIGQNGGFIAVPV